MTFGTSRRYDRARLRFYEAVGEQLRTRREATGKTRAATALLVGLTTTHLERIEAGLSDCPLHIVARLAEEWDCTIDDLAPVLVDEKEEA